MILADHEMHILRTFSGHRFESRQIRRRLRAAGLTYCGICNSVKDSSEFSGRLAICRPCAAEKSRQRYAQKHEEINRNCAAVRRHEREAIHKARSRHTEPDPSELLSDTLCFDFED